MSSFRDDMDLPYWDDKISTIRPTD